ncbi:hypothetical protein Hanom_Chr14g01289541 [Helianthus anomalus]
MIVFKFKYKHYIGKIQTNVIHGLSLFFFFFERQIWITDGPLEYHRATSGTTRSYPSPLDIMSIHQFRRKPNKYGKIPLWESNPGPIGPKILSQP